MKYVIKESQLKEIIKNAILETIDAKRAAQLMGTTDDNYQNEFQYAHSRAYSNDPFYKSSDALKGVQEIDAMLKEFQGEMNRINNAIRYIRSHNGMTKTLSPEEKAKRAASRKQNAALRQMYNQQMGVNPPANNGSDFAYVQRQHPTQANNFRNGDGASRSVDAYGQTSSPTNLGGTYAPGRGKFGRFGSSWGRYGLREDVQEEGLLGGIVNGIRNKINARQIQNAIDQCEQVIASAKGINNQQQAEQTIGQLKQYYQQFKGWYQQLNNLKLSIMKRSEVYDKNAEQRQQYNQGFKDFKKNQSQKQYKQTGTK